MSQNVSTNPKNSEPLTSPPPVKPWSAETEADRLMDELFSDLDNILEGGNRLPTEPAKPEYVSLKSIAIPKFSTPPAVKPSQENPSQSSSIKPTDSKSNEALDLKSSEALETHLAAKSSSSAPNRSGWPVERWLLLLGFVVLGMSLILLFLSNKKKLNLPEWIKPAATPSVQKSQVSTGDAQFAQYMLRSLNVIDNKIKKQQAAAPPGGTNGSNPASLPSPGDRSSASVPPQRVIERVYIPVYPPQTPVAPGGVAPSVVRPPVPTLSAPAPLRSVKPSTPSPAAKRAAPSPSPGAKRTAPSPSPAAKRAAPSPSPAAKRVAPSPSPAAAPIVLPPLPTVPSTVMVPTAPVTQSSESVSKHTLVGVMEQGERSAALFEVGGVTQYVYIGQGIADSGWTLVSIANQEAVIRRNGEVRSVYAGQSF